MLNHYLFRKKSRPIWQGCMHKNLTWLQNFEDIFLPHIFKPLHQTGGASQLLRVRDNHNSSVSLFSEIQLSWLSTSRENGLAQDWYCFPFLEVEVFSPTRVQSSSPYFFLFPHPSGLVKSYCLHSQVWCKQPRATGWLPRTLGKDSPAINNNLQNYRDI